ncbi:DUF4390 domain-containing protein [candidate division KSB1 bacterium]|nr:DUF4390 domain-containing protein [candidate division KSB1 bacterium]
MRQWFKIGLIAIVILGGWYSEGQTADKRVVIDTLTIEGERLLIDFHAEGLLDENLLERLRSGFTTTFEYQIQLWKDKPLLFSQLVFEKSCRIKLAYDHWDQRYQLIAESEERMTASVEKVREMCQEFQKFEFMQLPKLHVNSRYYITVRLILRPMSIENFEEIERALKGESNPATAAKKRKNPERPSQPKNRFLKFLLAVTGFGDKVFSSHELGFQLNNQRQLIWQK